MNFKMKKELSSGLCSNAYILDNEYIQLVGKRQDSFEIYKDIKSNADLLKGKITCVEIPQNMILIEPNEEYRYGSLIYPMVKGRPLNPEVLTDIEKENLAKKIVQFNKEMHSAEIHWNREKAICHELKKVYKNIEILKDYVEEEIIDQLFQYAKLFEDYLKSKKQFCITHGDLWAENLIVNDNNELSGIIDFGNMSYFLPEVDYASMWNMTEGFLDLLIKFNKEDMTKENIYLFVMHRELCSFEYIIIADPEDISSQLEKIKMALSLINNQITKQYV